MKNGRHKKTRTDPMDDEVNVTTVRYLDTGKFFRQKAAEHRFVQLDEDVFAEFPTSDEVNYALRLLMEMRGLGRQGIKRKKSA